MGLDVVLYGEDGSKKILEMSEGLHRSIFNAGIKWTQYSSLRPIKDYYKADALYEGGKLSALLDDLEAVAMLVPPDRQSELLSLVGTIRRMQIKRVRINGD